jgi:hypothetical protein
MLIIAPRQLKRRTTNSMRARIHARALLVVGEIMCLLGGGYADGALSRWRTLYELAVTASFLNGSGGELSERYLASVEFQALRDAKHRNECAEEAGIGPVSEEEVQFLERRCAALEAALGKEMRNEYGWAARALHKKKPNFVDLEAAVELGHWRPYYRWASQPTHAGYRPPLSILGTAESVSVEEVFLIGQSSSGLAAPMEMTAASLSMATSALILTKPSLDVLVIMNILIKLTAEIGPLASKLESHGHDQWV